MPRSFTQIVNECQGTVNDSWQQSAMRSFLGVSEEEFGGGVCLGLCAQFIGNPEWYLENRRKIPFKTGTLHLHFKYRGLQQEGLSGDDFISQHYLGWKPQAQPEVRPLSDGWPTPHMQQDGRYLLGLLKMGGGGHALAVIIQDQRTRYPTLGRYVLFDPNDGVASFASWALLNCALAHHLNDNYVPLGYDRYYVANWGV